MSKQQWQNELSSAFTNIAELCHFLNIPINKLMEQIDVAPHFPLRVPLHFAQKMEKGNINDPLLRQVLPLQLENNATDGYSLDPVGDIASNKTDGLIHKYENRVLLTLTGTCAIHCRYCFRRHFPYTENAFNQTRFNTILDYIKSDKKINEVILSGGDPLALPDKTILLVIKQIGQIKHIQTVRFHTRFPVVIPSRISKAFINIFSKTQLNIIFVLHLNHHREVCKDIKLAVQTLKANNITVLNQSVLLKGVNDSPKELLQLSNTLFSAGILPYYLHKLDKVMGAAHFDLSEATSKNIYTRFKSKTSGYLLPKFVKEIEGEKSKTNLL
jgi:EF-P beta-lysylation protein EpmB